jgi:hypothetical protein
MVGEKVQHYQGKGTNLEDLPGRIASYLESDGFTVQRSAASDQGSVVQAKKGGFLSEVIAADRALTVSISGEPDDFTVKIGIGKWIEHLGTTLIESLLLGELFLLVDVAEMAWNVEIENKLAKEIESIVG